MELMQVKPATCHEIKVEILEERDEARMCDVCSTVCRSVRALQKHEKVKHDTRQCILNLTLHGLFCSFRHKLCSSNTKDFLVHFFGQGHQGYPCDQVEMKNGPNERLLKEQ